MPAMHDQSPIRSPAVWITRAEPGARATAARVAEIGFEPIVAPLLTFQPMATSLVLKPGEALAFTSINGVLRAAALTPERDIPVFAVGDTTAAAARAAGFSDVVSASGDVEALAALIVETRPTGGVLHPAARETAGDLVGQLNAAGVAARKVAVYATTAVMDLPSTVDEVLQSGGLAAVLLHSPKAAKAAATVLARRADALNTTLAVGLSPACLDPLQAAGFKGLLAAEHPTEDALLEALAAATKRPDENDDPPHALGKPTPPR